MQSLHPLCDDGTPKASYELYERLGTSDSTVQPMSIECSDDKKNKEKQSNNKKRRKSSTQESLRITKKRTSRDKYKTSKQHTRTTNSSPISDQDSITTERVFRGFWNEYTTELSTKLWLPTKTDSVAMELSSSNGSSTRQEPNSWFTAKTTKNPTHPENLPMISFPFATSSLQETTEEEQLTTGKGEEQSKLPAGKVKKIRLFPTKQQRQILNNWFGTARWTYNQVLAGLESDVKLSFNLKDLRARFINNGLYEGTDKAWVIDTPYDVRDAAMIDVVNAYKSNFAKKKINSTHQFKIKFRSKYAESEAITIHSKHWKGPGMFHPQRFGKQPIRAAEPLPRDLVYDTKLVKDRLGRFFLCQILPLQEVQNTPAENVIALDPGVRTFMTGYSPEGTITEWGSGDMQRIFRLCHTHDKLQSKWSQKEVRHRKRYRLKKAARRVRKKIRNLVDEVHKKLTKWLVSNYETILLPKFETSDMVTRGQRKIGSKTARQMLTWSHYRFQQRLVNKTREYRNSQVIICDEAYTSKTCGCCGKLHEKLGGNKTFRCPHCGVVMDRDMNGARNILLRYLTLNRVVPQLRGGVGS